MNGSHVVELLSALADGALPAAEAERVRAHLATCAPCRVEWEALQQTLALVRSLPDETPPEDLSAAIMARIRDDVATAPAVGSRPAPAGRLRPYQGAEVPRMGHKRWGQGAVAAAAVAGLVLVLAAGVILQSMQGGGGALSELGLGSERAVQPAVGAGQTAGTGQVMTGTYDADVAAQEQAVKPSGVGLSGQDAAAAGEAAPVPTEPPALAGRKVVRSASLVLEVDDVEGTFQQLLAMVEAAGGFVQESMLSDEPGFVVPPARGGDAAVRRVARVVLRVPVDGFPRFVSQVMSLGEPRSYQTDASDITSQYVDTEARLRNLSAQEQRLLEIVGQARTVEELLQVEQQLWRVRGEIESLQAQLQHWDELVALATLHVTLEPQGVTPPSSGTDLGERLLGALYQAVEYMVAGVETMILGAGFLLPWAVLGAVIWLVYRWWRSRPGASRSS